jgi:8-oxo-dGTP diphosphatase
MATLGVNVAILQDSQVLLVQRNDLPVWGLPGGGVEDGESIAQAAVRETREETGLEVMLTRLVGIYSRPNWRYGGDHTILFAAKISGGRLLTVTGETGDARYFDVEALPDALSRYQYQRILDAFNGATGLVRSQDVAWPFGELTDVSEIWQRVLRGEIDIEEVQAAFFGRGELE